MTFINTFCFLIVLQIKRARVTNTRKRDKISHMGFNIEIKLFEVVGTINKMNTYVELSKRN